MSKQIEILKAQLVEVCKASKVDRKNVLAALLASYEVIGLEPIDPKTLPSILPDYDEGGLRIELSRMVATKDGELMKLTLTEWKILGALIKSDGRAISQLEIQNMLYGDEHRASNCIEVFFNHLRKKLGKNVILTMRGIGYVLASKIS